MFITYPAFYFSSIYSQTHERWDVKTISDGFVPDTNVVKNITVAKVQPKLKIKVKNTQARLNGDSTLVCDAVDPNDPFAKKSPLHSCFQRVRKFAEKLKVGDKVTFTGVLFQDKYHNPSANRTRNFIEMHPILSAK